MTPTEYATLSSLLGKLAAECARKGAPKSIQSNITDVEKSVQWLQARK